MSTCDSCCDDVCVQQIKGFDPIVYSIQGSLVRGKGWEFYKQPNVKTDSSGPEIVPQKKKGRTHHGFNASAESRISIQLVMRDLATHCLWGSAWFCQETAMPEEKNAFGACINCWNGWRKSDWFGIGNFYLISKENSLVGKPLSGDLELGSLQEKNCDLVFSSRWI